MSKPPSLKDVATAAEVDPSTASFVISGKGDKLRISPSTQARIMAAARQLGYRPNAIARDVALGRGVAPVITSDDSTVSATPREWQIGLVLSAASPAETLTLIPSLEPPLSAAGYELVVVTLPADQAAARERMLRGGFAGLLCCRTVYSAVSALVARACPTIVLWEGAAKAILNAVSLSPADATVEDSGQSAVSSPQPPVQPAPVPPPKPIAVAPVATPKPVIVEPTPRPVPAPVFTAEERIAPVVTGVSPVEASNQDPTPEPISAPVTVPAPVFTPEPEPVPVSAPSPALADPEPASSTLSPDVSVPTPATPELEPTPAPSPVSEPSPAVPDPEPVSSPLSSDASAPTPALVVEQTEITPVTVANPAADTAATTEENPAPVLTAEERIAPVVTGVSPVEAINQDPTPAPIVTATPPPEPVAPPPEPIAVPPPAVSPPPVPVIPVEPPTTIPSPAPVEVAPLPASPVAEELRAALPATADEATISTDSPLPEADSQAAGSPDKQEPPTS